MVREAWSAGVCIPGPRPGEQAVTFEPGHSLDSPRPGPVDGQSSAGGSRGLGAPVGWWLLLLRAVFFFFVLGDLIIYYFTGIKVDILKC